MRYVKPSLADLGTASLAIQGQGIHKRMPETDGVAPEVFPSTGSAYDLDE